ncbi:MAG: zinc-dependent metalloprotease [Bacteroidota bacterium]
MIKKLSFICLAIIASTYFKAQNQESGCGTPAPGAAWDNWMNGQVENFKKQAGKGQLVNYTIPVIVHIIHFGEAIGSFPNIDSNQVYSQIQVLNADFAGSGTGTVNVPSYFSSLIASTGIRFCMAQQNPQGTNLQERGIDRVSAIVNAWQSPATPTLDLKTYLNTVIIPATIWDPTKYFNIWISDKPSPQTWNGMATYPTGTGLTGLFGGQFGTSTNDGIWVWAKAFGTVGTTQSPYNKGRTTTHEIGHWLGLRHIWGDGNCLSDYCNDTPTAKGAHYGCVTNTPIDACGVNLSPNGEMPMNFMDMTDDACKYMFTPNQNIRIQTVMSQCPNRNLLGSHALCSATVTAAVPASSAVASFVLNSSQCVGGGFTPLNTSIGNPNPTYIWSASPAANFSPAATVPNPAISVSNPGTYTLSLVATNSVSSSTYTMLITASGSCQTIPLCLDSIKMIKSVDTLTTYKAPNSSIIIGCQTGFAGFLTGTNCYKDKAFAQYFPPSTYTAFTSPQVNSAIVFFDSSGTKGPGITTQIYCRVYGGSVGNGPGAVAGSKSDSLGKIKSSVKTVSVSYLGKSGYVIPNTKIIPFRFDFPSPVIVNPASGFFIGVETPILSVLDSIKIMHNTRYNSAVDSSAWYLQYNNTWRTFRYQRNAKIQLAIIPQITCSPVLGLKENKAALSANVNIMPNPSDGFFSLIFTLPKEESVDITIVNSLGQVISNDKIQHVNNHVFDINLSSKANGIYFVNIQTANEKTVKKIVVNH